MIRAPEFRQPFPIPSQAPRLAVIAAALATALAAGSACAQADAPAPVASSTHAAHAKAKAAKKHCKARPVRDDDAPDSFVYGRRDDVLAFAAQVADERGLDRAWVEDQLARARYQPAVAKAIMPAPAGT